jgi:hypothetical protein
MMPRKSQLASALEKITPLSWARTVIVQINEEEQK